MIETSLLLHNEPLLRFLIATTLLEVGFSDLVLKFRTQRRVHVLDAPLMLASWLHLETTLNSEIKLLGLVLLHHFL